MSNFVNVATRSLDPTTFIGSVQPEVQDHTLSLLANAGHLFKETVRRAAGGLSAIGRRVGSGQHREKPGTTRGERRALAQGKQELSEVERKVIDSASKETGRTGNWLGKIGRSLDGGRRLRRGGGIGAALSLGAGGLAMMETLIPTGGLENLSAGKDGNELNDSLGDGADTLAAAHDVAKDSLSAKIAPTGCTRELPKQIGHLETQAQTNVVSKELEKGEAQAAKAIAENAGYEARVRVTKAVGEALTKGVEKSVVEEGTSIGAKTVGKALFKKIPVLGILAGIGFGAMRAFRGDWAGAGMEVASGAVSTLPGLGTAASVGIDVALAAKDINDSIHSSEGGSIISKADDPPAKVLSSLSSQIKNLSAPVTAPRSMLSEGVPALKNNVTPHFVSSLLQARAEKAQSAQVPILTLEQRARG